MARIRTIKPEFWSSEQIVECSTSARLLFIGLWNFCDDGGVHQYSIKRIKMQVFPGDDLSDKQITELLDELLSAGLLRTFTEENKQYLHVTGWHHQKIDRPTLRFPQPTNDTEFDERSPNDRRGFDDTSTSPHPRNGMEWNGRETKGREVKAADAALPPFPSEIDSPRLRQSLADWLSYKGKTPKPRALKALVTRISKRVTAHGEQAVVDAIERAMAQDYKGWDIDDWFDGKGPTESRVATADDLQNFDLVTGATR